MTTLAYTVPTPGSDLNAIADPELASALTAIKTWANGSIDGTNVAATLTSRRLVGQATVTLSGSPAAGSYYVSDDGSFNLSGSTHGGAIWWHLDPANFAVTGKSNTQLVIRMSLATNGTAPGITIAGGLNAVTFTSGANLIGITVGASQGAASVATPASNAIVAAESSAFAFPAAGAFAPIIVTSGAAMTANAAVSINWQLFALNN